VELEVTADAAWPPAVDWAALCDDALGALSRIIPEFANDRLSASISLALDADVQELNREWRSKNAPTNVLSFPMMSRAHILALEPLGPPELFGDIIIALETCTREAADRGIALEQHVVHLIMHGLLHLAGYDHELSSADADAMEALEKKALALLGVADPYDDAEHVSGV
jgi:probable rRNA maturation factor